MEKAFAAGAILFRKENRAVRYLLVYSARNKIWGFPKGHIEAGEDEKAAAVREIFEETGIRDFRWVDGFRQEDVYVIFGQAGGRVGGRVEKHSIYYLAETAATAVRVDNDEISGYCWANLDEALALLSFEDLKNILIAADRFIKKGA